MKSIIAVISLHVLFGSGESLKADITVNVDAGAGWLGYMNVTELPENGGGGAFSSGWGTADLRASFSGSALTLSPNTINPPGGLGDVYWYKPDGTGNKIMDANMYVEVSGTASTVGALSGQKVIFTGTVTANTLTGAHTAVAFIKDFAPDFSSFNTVTAPLVNGVFTISLQTDPGVGRHVQYGFQTIGANVWSTDVAPFGSVSVAAIPLVPADPDVTVDPAAPWQGYMNVFNLPDPDDDGSFLQGYAQPVTSELRAAFSGNILTLSPYVIDPSPDGLADGYWYREDGSGNKSMEANMYVQPADGTLSGLTVNFTGTVLANSLTSGHTSIAYIKEFTANYSSFTVSSVVLAPGPFSISLAISNDPSRHVQYGFQTIGPNVWPANAGPFGSMQINDGSASSPFATWISGFNFSAFSNPDLTASGDPDGDGESNLQEFALNGNPASGAPSGRVRSRVETIAGDRALVLTLPVRGIPSPIFTGTLAKSATADQVQYVIEGSNGLSVFDQGVSEIIPASAENLPGNASGWTYRSFRLDGAIGGSTPRGPSGFLRARISSVP